MPDNSFDIVSKIDLAEVSNAIQQAMKEIHTRFDLKDSKSQIAMEDKEAILLHSADEFKLKAVNDVLQQKLVKRGVPLKGSDLRRARDRRRLHRETEDYHAARHPHRKGAGDREADQELEEKSAGLHSGRLVRVSSKDRDTLQEIIAMVKQAGFWHRLAVHELPEQLSNDGEAPWIPRLW